MVNNIVEYAAPSNIGQVSDRASSAHVSAGRRIAMQYNEAGAAIDQFGNNIGSTVQQLGKAYLDYQTHKEVSAGGLHASSLLLTKTQEWNDAVKGSDPNDPSTQPKFLEGLEKSLQNFRESFSTEQGQKWADHHVNTIRDHFNNITTADTSTMAGVAIHNNAVQTINNLTGVVDKDPASIDLAKGMLEAQVHSLVDTSPTLKGTAALKVKTDVMQKGMEQIVKAAVQSSIRKGGTGEEISNDPKYSPYVNAAERQQFVMEQRREERFANAEARTQKMWDKEQRKETDKNTIANFVEDMFSATPTTTREKINEARGSGKLSDDGYLTMQGIFERHTADKIPGPVADANAIAMIKDIQAGKITDAKPIFDALGDKLDHQRFKWVMSEFRDATSDDGSPLSKERTKFLNAYGPQVNPPNELSQRLNSGREWDLYQAAKRQEGLARAAGKSPHEAYDSNSPFFIGKQPEARPLSPWDLHQQMNNRSTEANAKNPPKPDWLGQFKNEALYDSKIGWFVVRDGKKLPVKQ